ncbi:hypothetical protein IV494_01095 [Kaistella sp. G5-32]|uniref:Glycosyltransferase involved in cell wall biosynthesis n=1 Tax=Kaistella gelatinilytica TaxID=2787636 RepID=A0ABS0F7T2_9FLAO|nr:hypothetical protein [Kaistella gelatinilytica]MBF8455763.1 hypothetical protein [Kaistella gelatinilytica]
MKQIAYIELDTHAEIARNFMELMKDSKEFVIDYYFSDKIFKQIKKNESNVFLSENTEILNQLSQKKYDVVIIGTVHRYFNLFKEITQEYNTAVIVHNLNFTNISRFQLFKNIFKKDFVYRLKLWLKEDLLAAPDVFKGARNILVLDKSLVAGKLKYLPVFFNEFQEKIDSKVFTIVIPGAVSQARRDYKKVIGQLSDLKIKTFEKPLEIVFLGKAHGKELDWIRDFDKKKPENISIKYFDKKVPQTTFNEWMNKADFLWCPIQSETEFFSNKEIYGETKMSGNIGDAIKFGKIAIFPTDYQSNFDFIINEKIDSTEEIFNFKSENSYDFQKEFSKKKISSELEKTLQSIL